MDNPIHDVIGAAAEARRQPTLAIALFLIGVLAATWGLTISTNMFWLILGFDAMIVVFALARSRGNGARATGDALGMLGVVNLSVLVVGEMHARLNQMPIQTEVVICALGIAIFAFLGRLAFEKTVPPTFSDFRDKWFPQSVLVGLVAGFVSLKWREPFEAADVASRATFFLAFFGAALFSAAWSGVTVANWLRPRKIKP